MGRNVWLENEDTASSHPHHKITSPFSAHMHSNARAGPNTEKLAAHDLTSAATWFQSNRYDTHFDHRNKEYAQLDHIFVSSSARKT
eukprot:15353393-Ditylum_brightwellii.AAC.1